MKISERGRRRKDPSSLPHPPASPVVFFERVELRDRLAKDADDLVDLGAVQLQLRVAVGHRVERFVLFEAFALEAEALAQLLDFGDEDEVEVLLAEVALALGAVDGAIVNVLDELKNKLPLALRTLENLG